jgi:hypothetical protein
MADIDAQKLYNQLLQSEPNLYEKLDTLSTSDWPVFKDASTQCFFAQDVYHCIYSGLNSFRINIIPDSFINAGAIQVEMSILSGDGGGLVFHATEQGHSGYRLFYGYPHIDLVGDYGELFYTQGPQGLTPETTIQLTMLAYEQHLLVYVDGKLLVHRPYDIAMAGWLGFMIVHFEDDDSTHLTFRNLRIWKDLSGLSDPSELSRTQTTAPDSITVLQEQLSLSRFLAEELSKSLQFEREEKQRLHAEVDAAHQKIDELTRSYYELLLEHARLDVSKQETQHEHNHPALQSVKHENSLRTIEPYREADRWFDEGSFNDGEQMRDMTASIKGFRLHAGNIVDGIQALYAEDSGIVMPPHGNVGEGDFEIELEPGDSWSRIEGFYGEWFGGEYVLQLTFSTRQGKTYGPYGNMDYATDINPFSLVAEPGEHIVALTGTVATGDNGRNLHLGALGLILRRE